MHYTRILLFLGLLLSSKIERQQGYSLEEATTACCASPKAVVATAGFVVVAALFIYYYSTRPPKRTIYYQTATYPELGEIPIESQSKGVRYFNKRLNELFGKENEIVQAYHDFMNKLWFQYKPSPQLLARFSQEGGFYTSDDWSNCFRASTTIGENIGNSQPFIVKYDRFYGRDDESSRLYHHALLRKQIEENQKTDAKMPIDVVRKWIAFDQNPSGPTDQLKLLSYQQTEDLLLGNVRFRIDVLNYVEKQKRAVAEKRKELLESDRYPYGEKVKDSGTFPYKMPWDKYEEDGKVTHPLSGEKVPWGHKNPLGLTAEGFYHLPERFTADFDWQKFKEACEDEKILEGEDLEKAFAAYRVYAVGRCIPPSVRSKEQKKISKNMQELLKNADLDFLISNNPNGYWVNTEKGELFVVFDTEAAYIVNEA